MQIKSLLDFVDYFNLAEIRKVYFIICNITYSKMFDSNNDNSNQKLSNLCSTKISNDSMTFASNNINDYLHNLINKQLSSSLLKYKQFGVIGAIMMIENLAKKSEDIMKMSVSDEATNSNSDSINNDFFSCTSSPSMINNSNPNETVDIEMTTTASTSMHSGIVKTISGEIKNIWRMIIECSRSSPESIGLFQDDLTCLIYKNLIPTNVELLIKNNLKQMTQDLFVIDPDYGEIVQQFPDKLTPFQIGYEFGNFTKLKL
jgi:hypothetical protein